WLAGLEVFRRFPVFGCGLGNFPRLASEIDPALRTMSPSENVHNYFLQILAELGLAGFFIFLAVLIYAWKSAIHFFQSSESTEDSISCYALVAGLSFIVFTSLTGHPFILLKMQFLFWLLFGLLLALCRPQRSAMLSTTAIHSIYVIIG